MAEAASLIEKYRVDGGTVLDAPCCISCSMVDAGVDLSKAAEIHHNILSFKPEWDSYEASSEASPQS